MGESHELKRIQARLLYDKAYKCQNKTRIFVPWLYFVVRGLFYLTYLMQRLISANSVDRYASILAAIIYLLCDDLPSPNDIEIIRRERKYVSSGQKKSLLCSLSLF